MPHLDTTELEGVDIIEPDDGANGAGDASPNPMLATMMRAAAGMASSGEVDPEQIAKMAPELLRSLGLDPQKLAMQMLGAGDGTAPAAASAAPVAPTIAPNAAGTSQHSALDAPDVAAFQAQPRVGAAPLGAVIAAGPSAQQPGIAVQPNLGGLPVQQQPTAAPVTHSVKGPGRQPGRKAKPQQPRKVRFEEYLNQMGDLTSRLLETEFEGLPIDLNLTIAAENVLASVDLPEDEESEAQTLSMAKAPPERLGDLVVYVLNEAATVLEEHGVFEGGSEDDGIVDITDGE